MRISDWSSDVCSSDLGGNHFIELQPDDERARCLTPGDISVGLALILEDVLDNARQPLGALAEHALGGADQIVALVGLIRLRGRGRRGGIAGLLVGGGGRRRLLRIDVGRSEEHTSELQSLMRISYAVFCLKKKKINTALQ